MLGSREAGTSGGGEAAAGSLGAPSRTHPGEEKPSGRAGCHVTVVSWKRSPCRTSALFAAANTLVWFVASSCFRVYSLVAVLLALLVVTATARDLYTTMFAGAHLWSSMTTR